MPLLFQKQVRR